MKTSFRFAFRSNFEACKKVWVCKLRLTWPRPRAVDRCEAILFECMQPAMYRVSTGSAKPRSFHGALSLNQTKRLSTWRSVTPPISSAGNRDIAFAAEKLCADKLFALDSDGRCSIHRSRRKKAFFLTQAAPRGREQVVCLSAVSQATFRALGTKRVGKLQRQIGVWGWLWHLQWGSGWFWCPQAKIRSKKVIKGWFFRIFRSPCILCKWGARQAAEFRQEPRRSTTDLYRCFLRTGRPPKTANPRDSGLFCLLLLLERPFLPPPSQRDRPQTGDFP